MKIDFESVAALDLAKHLDKRIETVLRDYMDRCAECGIGYENATVKAVTVLGHYFTIAAGGIEATEQEIVATCQWHYARMKADERTERTESSSGTGPAGRRCLSQ